MQDILPKKIYVLNTCFWEFSHHPFTMNVNGLADDCEWFVLLTALKVALMELNSNISFQ